MCDEYGEILQRDQFKRDVPWMNLDPPITALVHARQVIVLGRVKFMLRLVFVLPLLALFQCDRDETVAAYGASDRVWSLQEIDDQTFGAPVTLRIAPEGQIAGEAPCNSYTAKLNAPYPWFEVTDLAATRKACPQLEAEGTYFAALMAMTQSEVSGDVLILRNEDGHEMVFKAAG